MTTSTDVPHNTATGVAQQDWTDAFALKFDVLKSKETFLEAFAEDVVIEATLGPRPMQGADAVFAGIARVMSNYDTVPRFTHQATNGNRTYLEWEVTAFADPDPIRGITVLTRNAEGKISHIALHHRSLFKILRLAHHSLPGLTNEQRQMLLVEDTLTDEQRRLLVTGEDLTDDERHTVLTEKLT